MSRIRILSFLFCCWACAAAAGVRVGAETTSLPLAGQVLVLEDASGALTLEEVKARGGWGPPPAAEGAEIHFGFSSSAWWLRLDIAADPGAARDWLLEVAFPSLDRIDLFAPGGEHFVAGDLLPFAARLRDHRHFVFPLRLGEAEGGTFWLRIASEGTLSVPLRLWREEAFWPASQASQGMLAVFLGTLLALAGYQAMLAVIRRDRLHLDLVLLAAGVAVGQATLAGWGNQYLWPGLPAWGNVAFGVGFAIAGVASALLTRDFLDSRRRMPRVDGVLLGLAAVFAACAAMPLFAPYRLALIVTSLSGAAFCVVAVLAGMRSWHTGQPGAKFFLLAWLAMAAGVGVFGLRSLALLPAGAYSRHALEFGSVALLLLLSLALSVRREAVHQEAAAALAADLGASRQESATLRRSVAGLEARIDRGTRDVETAQARLREFERQIQALVHTDALTGLANRLLFQARLEQSMQLARRTNGQIALLLLDLDRFKAINDRYGQAIGDEVLRQAGARCRAAVRAVDTVARLDGDEFAIVLTGLGSGADAELSARKIIAALGEPLRVLGVPLEIGVSVGIALFPAGDASPGELLNRASRAVQEAKAAGRGGYRVFPG